MLQELWQQTVQVVSSYVPNLLAALGVLLVGWVAALIIAAVVRGALRRTSLGDRISKVLADDAGGSVDIDRVAGRVAFYLAMLVTLVVFFDVLNLTVITEPLNALLSEVASYVPRVLGAGGLLLIAWILAAFIRKVLLVSLKAAEVDRRLGGETGMAGDGDLAVSGTFAEAVYWLILLLFLPAVLGALGVEGLLGPVERLVDQVLGFVPNLSAALLIFVIGWFVARLVQRVISNLGAAAGLDTFADRVGLGATLGDRKLSSLTGLLLYVLILIPVLISSLQALRLDAITVPASSMLSRILDAIPFVLGAMLLLALAYFVARLVAELVVSLLRGAGFDNVLDHLGISHAPPQGGASPSALAGTIILVTIMLFAAIEAASMLGFVNLAALISGFVVFAGQVIVGLIVFAIGLYLARLAARSIRASGAPQSGILGSAAYAAILVLAGAMALRQMGLAEDIINLAFGLLLGSVAVAAALAFGLGARDIAGQHVEKWIGSLESLPPSDD